MRTNNLSAPTLRNRILADFLADIRRYPVLTPDEEAELFMEYADPSTSDRRKEDIRNTIICSNLRFVYSSAKLYEKNPSKVLDIVNEANIGLITAFPLFDASRGFRFITFAVNYMRRGIDWYIKKTDVLVKRTNESRIGAPVRRIKSRFFAENGREPSEEEIKDILLEDRGIEVNDDRDILDATYIRTDVTIDNDNSGTVLDVGDIAMTTSSSNDIEEYVEAESVESSVNGALNILTERERTIIRLLFGIGYEREHTADEVAMLIAKNGEKPLTAMRINQIRKAAIEKMQKYAKKIAC